MKKPFVLILCLYITCTLYSQSESSQNKLFLGGSINFSIQNNAYPFFIETIDNNIDGINSSTTNDIRNINISINPHFGKELKDNLYVGFSLAYTKGYFRDEEGARVSGLVNGTFELVRNSNQFGIGIFSRHILFQKNKLNFFFSPKLEYNTYSAKTNAEPVLTTEDNASYLQISSGVGIQYNLSEKIRVTLRTGGITYTNGKWQRLSTERSTKFNSLSTNFNLTNASWGIELRF